jgi:hypothetical protein
MKTSISSYWISLSLCVLAWVPLRAQTNYVVNTPNSLTPSVENVIIGPAAGNSTMVAPNNVFIGNETGSHTTNGGQNVFVGYEAGKYNTTGYANVFTGAYAGLSNTVGYKNTFLGNIAGSNTITGYDNVYGGFAAGLSTTTGFQNAFLGSEAGRSNTAGNNNAFLGFHAGTVNTTGSYNAFMGPFTGQSNTTGYSNVYVGVKAGNTNQTGHNNVMLGDSAGFNNTVSNNIYIGSKAGFASTTASFNVFTGGYAGYANTTGSFNVITGLDAGHVNTTGSFNVFTGHQAGLSNVTGNQNTMVGYQAGRNNTTGQSNVFIGYDAGVPENVGNLTNAVAIGYNSRVTQSNSLILGANANVGIGTSSPATKLQITTGTANTSGLRLENLTSSSPASVTNQYKFLSVDGAGNVILASSNGSAREAAPESLWQRTGSFLQSSQGAAIIIGQGVTRTPSDYNLFVSKGILTEKVKVAVKNTDEWSDKVFAAGYTLKSLTDVEAYIKEHQHLPGIPSAKEMVESGNDLHKTDVKLLEKIEELTLYMIELTKENQALKQQVNLLLTNKRN